MKKAKSLIKYFSLGFVLLYISLAAIGCFQFRTAPKKVPKIFEDKNKVAIAKSIVLNERTTLNYVETLQNDSSSPVVIFVHGSPGSSDNFFSSMLDSTLYADFQMLSIDRLGFGYSQFGKPVCSLDSHASVIFPLLKKYVGRKVILVGHSYGGPVVVKAATMYSKYIHGIVVVSGSVSAELEPTSWWRKPADFFLFRWLLPRSFNSSNTEILALEKELEIMEKDWDKITSHVYLLHGTEDNLVPHENVDYAKDQLKNAGSITINKVKGVNHFIPFMYEDLIQKALLEIKEM